LFRKLLVRFAVPLAVGTALMGIAAPAANAETSGCYWNSGDGMHYCFVDQVTAAGLVHGFNDYYPPTHYAYVGVQNQHSGFSVIAWAEQRYNGGPATTQWGPTVIASGDSDTSSVWDEGLYQARTCFKFTWASAAVHCTAWF
jgi:hypothetical protein